MSILFFEFFDQTVEGGFLKMSCSGVKSVILGHFWVEKRYSESFLGQTM